MEGMTTTELTIPANPTAPDPVAPSQEDHELAAAWERAHAEPAATETTPADGPVRGADGKFVAAEAEAAEPATTETGDEQPAEAEQAAETPEVEAQPEVAAEVAMPANLRGMEKAWEQIPAEARAALAPHLTELHERASQLGRNLASWKPIADVIGANKQYFDGTVSKHDPAQAISYLFNVQREMDADPIKTILGIADTYKVREKLATALGTTAAPQPQNANENADLRRHIAGLEQTIKKLSDPATIDDRITARLSDEKLTSEISRFSALAHVKPLIAQVQGDMPHFIAKAWAKLGKTAAPAAVLQKAFDMAVDADPDLRAKSAAAKQAAASDAEKAKAAAAAKSINVKSNSTGKARQLTETEELGQIFDRVSKK